MKQLNITYEDQTHHEIESIKNQHGGNWHDFVLDLARYYAQGKAGVQE